MREKESDIRYKAKLGAKWLEQSEEGIDYNEIFTPLVKYTSIRILLALVAQFNLKRPTWCENNILNWNLDETIYMLQPKGFEKGGKMEFV